MNTSKAVAAGIGGAIVGIGGSMTPVMPEGTPWWGYLIMWGISTLVPAIITYIAPANKPN